MSRACIAFAGAAVGLALSWACDGGGSDCGPTSATVARVIDGDTVELDTGERIRYLLVDTPEVSGTQECFGPEATDFNRSLVEGQQISLSYDTECTDDFDRLLAYVKLGDRDVNALIIERGFGCVLQIPPNGEDRVDDYRRLEAIAEAGMVGLWGACMDSPC